MKTQIVREYIKIQQMDTLAELINKVPDTIAYNDVYFDYEAYIADDGNPYCAVSFYYDRPETIEEASQREALEKRRLQLDIERDKRQLNYLLSVYGVPEAFQKV